MNLEFILADRSPCLEEEFRAYHDAIYYHDFMMEQSWSLRIVQITWTFTEAQCSTCSLCAINKILFFLLLFGYERASQNSNLQNVKVSSMKFLTYYFVSYRGVCF